MKRLLFYMLLVIQAAIIAVLGGQYFFIDQYGESINLLLQKDLYPHIDMISDQNNYYLEFEINAIDQEKWDHKMGDSYHQRVYVLLEADENDIYHVKRASDHQLEASANQIVLIGKYNYYDSMLKLNYVTYGFEQIKDQRLLNDLKEGKGDVAVLTIAPWNQKKISEIIHVNY